jgi:8-oxo-dGTP diphosphatase
MSVRDHYIDCLRRVVPFDEIEHRTRSSAIEWIESGGTIFRRYKTNNPPTERHFVSYFPMLDFETRRIFLVFHKKANIWLPPGGHIEPDETPLEAAVRECGEELGIPARFIDSRPFFVSSVTTQNTPDPHLDIAFWFVMVSSVDERLFLDTKEFSDSNWFDISAPLPTNAERNLPRFLRKLAKSGTYAFTAESRELARRVTLPSLMPS